MAPFKESDQKPLSKKMAALVRCLCIDLSTHLKVSSSEADVRRSFQKNENCGVGEKSFAKT